MAALSAKVVSAQPQGQNLVINVTFYLATDVDLLSPLGSTVVTVPANLSAANIQKQIVAAGSDFRSSYNLIATYTGTVINIP